MEGKKRDFPGLHGGHCSFSPSISPEVGPQRGEARTRELGAVEAGRRQQGVGGWEQREQAAWRDGRKEDNFTWVARRALFFLPGCWKLDRTWQVFTTDFRVDPSVFLLCL